MFRRRTIIAAGGAFAAASLLSGFATLAHDNPMPPELREALERDTNAPVLGNPQGNVTLTEFFDYNCHFCRESVSDIHALISEDKDLRLVFREWPVFGEGSVFAARASLASLKQGKYWPFHTALMKLRGQVAENVVMATARRVGLDAERLRRDMQASEVTQHLDHSMLLADHMGLQGTPTFIAGHNGVFGKQSMASLRAMIAQAREDLL
ncbi:DsbA family protein [Paracoccus sp. DMF-8]|uniref:DsbA family protein n=1 Tax=Paracoccus sp. DMF-8 TaxID=3019445 RepID=UPI0023E82779|nr:DsbA family protein [Paracoccus sp. DMF-8]MDF3607121.1 DsbA family protein [Paracoccus sp. DMF-8]